jgi:predicted XRE-type DNA-binding protein
LLKRGLQPGEDRATKAHLAVAINKILDEAHLSQASAAQVLGISQPKVSALANFKLDGFSVERLLTFLNALGRDVEITIRKRRFPGEPKILVLAA